jgi:hypothetical protein
MMQFVGYIMRYLDYSVVRGSPGVEQAESGAVWRVAATALVAMVE